MRGILKNWLPTVPKQIHKPDLQLEPGSNQRSVKSQIERTPRIKRREFIWIKAPRGKLQSVPARGRKFSATFLLGPLLRNLKTSDVFLVHQLPSNLDAKIFGSLASPSPRDLKLFLEFLRDRKQFKNVNLTRFVIAILDRHGSITGYTFVHFNKQLVEKLRSGNLSSDEWRQYRFLTRPKKSIFASPIRTRFWTDEAISTLENFGARLRFRPMPGFRYDPKKKDFVKKETQTSTSRPS